MHSFLTISFLVASLIASSNASPIRGARSLKVKNSKKEGGSMKMGRSKNDRELTTAPLVPGLFSLQLAFLSGDQEVPPIEVETNGDIQVAFDEDFEHLAYSLIVDIGENTDVQIVQAHFHCGSAGINGPVFAVIYDSTVNTEMPDQGILKVEGLLTNANLVTSVDFASDPLCGKPVNTIASIYELIEARMVYVNVHSMKNAGGEIRGQIFMKPM